MITCVKTFSSVTVTKHISKYFSLLNHFVHDKCLPLAHIGSCAHVLLFFRHLDRLSPVQETYVSYVNITCYDLSGSFLGYIWLGKVSEVWR